MVGLRRAMQEAGVRAVLMSMWSVPDEETQKLMTMLYAKWLVGQSKHEAFHEAQLKPRKKIIARWGDDRPYLWAAFVLVGR
jgi:CHAT domain-containing protein